MLYKTKLKPLAIGCLISITLGHSPLGAPPLSQAKVDSLLANLKNITSPSPHKPRQSIAKIKQVMDEAYREKFNLTIDASEVLELRNNLRILAQEVRKQAVLNLYAAETLRIIQPDYIYFESAQQPTSVLRVGLNVSARAPKQSAAAISATGQKHYARQKWKKSFLDAFERGASEPFARKATEEIEVILNKQNSKKSAPDNRTKKADTKNS